MILNTVKDFVKINFSELDSLISEDRLPVICQILNSKNFILNDIDLGRRDIYTKCLNKSIEILFDDMDAKDILNYIEEHDLEKNHILKNFFALNNVYITSALINVYLENSNQIKNQDKYNILFGLESLIAYDYNKYDILNFTKTLKNIDFFNIDQFKEYRKDEFSNFYIVKENQNNSEKLINNYDSLFDFNNKQDIHDVITSCLFSCSQESFLKLHSKIESFLAKDPEEYFQIIPSIYTRYLEEIIHLDRNDYKKVDKTVNTMILITNTLFNSHSFINLDPLIKEKIKTEVLYDKESLKETVRGIEVFNNFNSSYEKSVLSVFIHNNEKTINNKRRI